MNNKTIGAYKLNNIGRINIILGKNGCGKSTLLRQIDQYIAGQNGGLVKYITPERGGQLVYDPGIELAINNDSRSFYNSRRKNRHEHFREQSAAQFRSLELLFLREKAASPSLSRDESYQFNNYIERINNLLENIEIKIAGNSFKIFKKNTIDILSPDKISSGESELIALAIECLVFEKECINDKDNYLILDEPDVHLHPDLQAKLCQFLIDIVRKKPNATIFLATHSTAILGALSEDEAVHIEFMHSNQKEINFKPISTAYQHILPIFGAHPLSNLFNKMPIFLVEGEDDARIWQQAVRSSNNKLKLYPCVAGSKPELQSHEEAVEEIIGCVYDEAKAYSLRDRDEDASEDIDNLKIIKRYKLACRSAENLLLTNEVLAECNFTFDKLKSSIEEWLNNNRNHAHYKKMLQFKESNFSRKIFDLKEIRNDLLSILASPCNWELLVGKCLGHLLASSSIGSTENSMGNYLGSKLLNMLTEVTGIS